MATKFKLILILVSLSLCLNPTSAAPPADKNADQPGMDTRLLGGEFCSRPYQVALIMKLKNGKKSFCGGSLIAPGWVLTAAHCTEAAKNITLNFGSVLRTLPHKSANSTEFFEHPQWDKEELKNDCALVKYAQEDVDIDGSNITTVRLPSLAQMSEKFEQTKATVSGWGRESDFAISPGDKLRCLTGNIIPNGLCGAPYFGAISAEHICMEGRPQSSTCHGDSGGPLVMTDPMDKMLTQIGIVSFGPAFGCGWGWPPVFARVTTCQPWIMEMTKIEPRPK